MAIHEIKGPTPFISAVEAALSAEYSAVILRGTVRHPRKFGHLVNEGNHMWLLGQVVALDGTIDKIRAWSAANDSRFDRISLSYRSGGIPTHTDPRNEAPFDFSVGIRKPAVFYTQLYPGGAPPISRNTFVPGLAVDQFEQMPGDIVVIPNGSIHKVVAPAGRKAVLYRSVSEPKTY